MQSVRRVRQPRQHFRNPLINRGVVELVQAVIAKKILQSSSNKCFVVRVNESPAHQRGRAIPHIACNDVAVQCGALDMAQHRIHGMNQIKARVNQGAIKVKHQQADATRIKRAQEANHGEFRITQVSGLRSHKSLPFIRMDSQ